MAICGCSMANAQTALNQTAANETGSAGNGTEIEIANVLFRYSPALTVSIVRLRGKLIPTAGHDVPNFNDSSSFVVASDAAEMRMSMAQLSALMNAWLLRSPKAQLKNVSIEAQGGELLIHGTMKKGLHIPFNSKATADVTGDNRIRFTVKQVKAAGVPMKGVLDALGLSMENLVSQKGLHGMSVDGDSFLVDPQTALPPPQIRAKLTGVRISGQSLVISIGQGAPTLSPRPWKNYIALRGGSVKYGRDEMFDTDLTMIDTTPGDPFEFYLDRYWRQMVAGTIKTLPDRAWRAFLPDYSKVPKGSKEPGAIARGQAADGGGR
jgi:hypothetical protein